MNKIYVGSTNNAKVKAVKDCLPDFEVIPVKVNSNVSLQPMSDEETIQGALNRAKSLPNDGLQLGLEAGVQIHNKIMFLVNWGVLIDKDNVYYAGGTRIPLPDNVKNELLNGDKELSDVMEKVANEKDIRSKEGAIGYFTMNQVVRSDIFVHIVKLLYGQYLFNKEKTK